MPFELDVSDNHSWMVGSADRLDPNSGCPACAVCGYRTDPEFTAKNFVLRQKRYDISCCYDGAIIVSDAFRQLCVGLAVEHLRFDVLATAPGFFHLKCSAPIPLDYEAMGTEAGRLCSACGLFRDVVGYDRIVMRNGAVVAAHGLAFSDRWFGSNNAAIPLILAGDRLVEALRAAKLKGVASYKQVMSA